MSPKLVFFLFCTNQLIQNKKSRFK